MKAGSMEGLIGASQNMKLVDVPMRVYREAERKGDTAIMERAMGYAADFTEKAYEYKEKAQDELIKELKEEKEELEEKLEENREFTAENENVEIEISEEGQKLSEGNSEKQQCISDIKIDTTKIYNKNGNVVTSSSSENAISVKL